MIKKIYFAGCSITAGNELWEEAHIPGYSSMTFKESRKVMDKIPNDEEVLKYNNQNSFPALVGKQLSLETINLGFSGISNKELGLRILTNFPEKNYEDVMVVIQLTTHNRMLIKYKEENDSYIFGSFVIMPDADDSRLTKRQNNLLKETFFEFSPESMLVMDDHIFIYYAVEALKNKGIPVYLLWSEVEIINWANWDISSGSGSGPKFQLLNDKDPQWIENLSNHFVEKHHDYNLLGTTLQAVAGKNSRLPRLHYKKEAHEKIATIISEKIRCLLG